MRRRKCARSGTTVKDRRARSCRLANWLTRTWRDASAHALSGVNPGDTKKRRGWLGSSMPYPRVIPHSDGAGIVDAVGSGVAPIGTVRSSKDLIDVDTGVVDHVVPLDRPDPAADLRAVAPARR
jgi:hypothetical protein